MSDSTAWQPPTLATVVAVDEAIVLLANRTARAADDGEPEDLVQLAQGVWNLAAARENLSARPYPKPHA